MNFLYQDMRSASGRFLAHSEKQTVGGRTVYVLQLIDLSSGAVNQQSFNDWNTYSQRYDMMRTVILPFK